MYNWVEAVAVDAEIINIKLFYQGNDPIFERIEVQRRLASLPLPPNERRREPKIQ
jgi:hypothetical protein